MTALHRLALRGPGFPPLLARIPGAPAELFVKGHVEALAGPMVAVVGTREASEAGLRAARAVGVRLAAEGVCVVSGLARGVDRAAHEGALHQHGATVAVLAHGLDRIYPAEHAGLAGEIVRLGGALVSEHEDGTPPAAAYFVARNRITTGLCLATVLVESGADGGSMHSVRFASEQGRPVFAVWSDAPKFNRAGAVRARSEFGATLVRTPFRLARELEPLVEMWRSEFGREGER